MDFELTSNPQGWSRHSNGREGKKEKKRENSELTIIFGGKSDLYGSMRSDSLRALQHDGDQESLGRKVGNNGPQGKRPTGQGVKF